MAPEQALEDRQPALKSQVPVRSYQFPDPSGPRSLVRGQTRFPTKASKLLQHASPTRQAASNQAIIIAFNKLSACAARKREAAQVPNKGAGQDSLPLSPPSFSLSLFLSVSIDLRTSGCITQWSTMQTGACPHPDVSRTLAMADI